MVLRLFIAASLIVGVAGFLCTCCEAAPVNEVSIQTAPCHDCCGAMQINSSRCEGETVKKLFILPSSADLLRVVASDQRLSFEDDTQPQIASSGQSYGGLAMTNSHNPSEPPVYLLNQVFRI